MPPWRLIEVGELVTATEYANRCGLDSAAMCSDEELVKAAAQRRESHVQLPAEVAAGVIFVDDEAGLVAGAYTRSFLSST